MYEQRRALLDGTVAHAHCNGHVLQLYLFQPKQSFQLPQFEYCLALERLDE